MFSINVKVERQGKGASMEMGKEEMDDFQKILFSFSYLL